MIKQRIAARLFIIFYIFYKTDIKLKLFRDIQSPK